MVDKEFAKLLRDHNLKCHCIRCREIKKNEVDPDKTYLRILKYSASGGTEYFLQYVNDKDNIIGFLRFRIIKKQVFQLKVKLYLMNY